MSSDELMQQIAQMIRNDTRELPTGADYLCTEASFKESGDVLSMVIQENYFVRKTKRVAMTETRHVPLAGVRDVTILEDQAHPHWERRFMVLIRYAAGGRSADKYVPVDGGNQAFGEVQAFTLGTYTLSRAQKIVSGLKTLRDLQAKLDE